MAEQVRHDVTATCKATTLYQCKEMAEQVRHDAWRNGDNMTSKKASGKSGRFSKHFLREDYFLAVL